MPIYQYEVLNGDVPAEFFEVEQRMDDEPLTKHPLTKEPVKRILLSASLSLKHTSQNEVNSLSADNLNKNGFSSYERDSSSGNYFRTAGTHGPAKLSEQDLG